VRDDALGLAAQLAYYLILAIFPFILFLVAVLDAFGSSSPQFVNELFDYLRRVMPAQVFDLIETYTERTLRNEDTAPGLLSVGILGTIWAASGAFAALINALNRAYDVQETRPVLEGQGHRHPDDARVSRSWSWAASCS
jgi:membrane protein